MYCQVSSPIYLSLLVLAGSQNGYNPGRIEVAHTYFKTALLPYFHSRPPPTIMNISSYNYTGTLHQLSQ